MNPRGALRRLSLAEAIRLHAQSQAAGGRSEPFAPPQVPPIPEIRAPKLKPIPPIKPSPGYRGVK
jgi:hypothetical protein